MKQTNFGANARKFVMGLVMLLGFVFLAGTVSAQSATKTKADLTPQNYKDAAVAQYDLDAQLTQLRAYIQTNPSLTPQQKTEYSLKGTYWSTAKTALGNGENVEAADKAGIQSVMSIVNSYATYDSASLSGVNVDGTLQAARNIVKN